MTGDESAVDDFVTNLQVERTPFAALLQDIKDGSGSIHIIVSTLAGTGTARAFYEEHLVPLLEKFGLKDQYVTHFTKSEHTVSELGSERFARKAAEGQQQLIILLSGDGGVIDTLNALAPVARQEGYRPPCVALLPFGTGNALANSARVASDDTFGLATLVRGKAKALPAFKVQFSPGAKLFADEARVKEDLPRSGSDLPASPDGRRVDGSGGELYGAVVCSWGFHAAIVADSDTAEFRKHGIDRFKLAAEEASNPADGKGPHQYLGDVYSLKSGQWTKVPRDKHAYILATMVSNLEKTFMISPASKPLDGSLRLVHFGPLPGDQIINIMMKAYDKGNHVNLDAVGYEDIDGLWIDFKEEADDGERWRRVCVDGKIIAVEKGGWVCVRKVTTNVLEVIVPQ